MFKIYGSGIQNLEYTLQSSVQEENNEVEEIKDDPLKKAASLEDIFDREIGREIYAGKLTYDFQSCSNYKGLQDLAFQGV